MLFNSAVFLFLFLPTLLLLYYVIPKKLRNGLLFLSSLFFYTWGEQELVVIMLLSTIVDFSAGILIEQGKKKLGLILSLAFNLGLLAVFKYLDFFFENYNFLLGLFGVDSGYLLQLPGIALPIGISFYTFQTMSYTIDVYYGKVKANRNFIDFGAYVTMFPQLIAGPIVRYADINEQLKYREVSVSKFAEGVERFIIGLAKKMIFANTFGYIADGIFMHNPADLTTGAAWLGIIAYALQIYFDFSAYSDMAIGLGKMFGFDILENFNYPYIARSIKEFWRRWHISLSTWFRDYLYIPLGGNKKGTRRTYINLFIVFFITGMWHGSSWNFIIWGLFHGLFLVIERIGFDKILEKTWRPVQHLYALLIALIGWVFFRAEDLPQALDYLLSMGGINKGILNAGVYLDAETILIFILGFILAMPVYKPIRNHIEAYSKMNFGLIALFVYYLFLGALLFISIAIISSDTYSPFIYFRF